MSVYDDLQVGQVWRWYNTPDVFYHCLLLKLHRNADEDDFQIWEILDLDSENAGRCTLAFFREDDQRSWVRLT